MRNFDQKYKFSNNNDMVSPWRNFQKKILVACLHMINETLSPKFHPYSILTGQVTVEWLMYKVLKLNYLLFSFDLLLSYEFSLTYFLIFA